MIINLFSKFKNFNLCIQIFNFLIIIIIFFFLNVHFNCCFFQLFAGVEGWLLKQKPKGLIKEFRKRWFTLTEDILYYFETKEDSAFKVCLILHY